MGRFGLVWGIPQSVRVNIDAAVDDRRAISDGIALGTTHRALVLLAVHDALVSLQSVQADAGNLQDVFGRRKEGGNQVGVEVPSRLFH